MLVCHYRGRGHFTRACDRDRYIYCSCVTAPARTANLHCTCNSMMDCLAVDGFPEGRRRLAGSGRCTEVTGPVLYWMSRDQRVQGMDDLIYT